MPSRSSLEPSRAPSVERVTEPARPRAVWCLCPVELRSPVARWLLTRPTARMDKCEWVSETRGTRADPPEVFCVEMLSEMCFRRCDPAMADAAWACRLPRFAGFAFGFCAHTHVTCPIHARRESCSETTYWSEPSPAECDSTLRLRRRLLRLGTLGLAGAARLRITVELTQLPLQLGLPLLPILHRLGHDVVGRLHALGCRLLRL